MLSTTSESRGTSRNLGLTQKSGLPRRGIASSSAVLGCESCWASHVVSRADWLCAGLWEPWACVLGLSGALGTREPGCLASPGLWQILDLCAGPSMGLWELMGLGAGRHKALSIFES